MLSAVDPFVRYVAKSTYFIDATVTAPDCRLLYVLAGEGSFEAEGTLYPLQAGTLVYYPGGTAYHICARSELFFYTLNFDFTHRYVKEYPAPFSPKRNIREEGLILREGIPAPWAGIMHLQYGQFAEPYLRRIYEESIRPAPESPVVTAACLKLLLVDALRGANPTQNPVVCRVTELVAEDLRRNNRELAQILGYHPYYLNQLFSKETGLSLHQYVLKERVARAREQITAGKLTLAEIAEQCGFSSLSHLSRAIKREYGVSPSRIRKEA